MLIKKVWVFYAPPSGGLGLNNTVCDNTLLAVLMGDQDIICRWVSCFHIEATDGQFIIKYCITVQRSLIENFKVGASQDVLAFFLWN